MNRTLCFSLIVFATSALFAGEKPIQSKIIKEKNGDLFVQQEVIIPASIDKVWAAYTTSEGWRSWVAPVGEVDLKIGGKIRSNYRKGGKLDDKDTITLNIINYVPKRVLTLQAVVSNNFPALKKDEKRMYNVITFEKLSDAKTKLVSYGIGYRDTPEHRRIVNFFIPANEATHKKLISVLSK